MSERSSEGGLAKARERGSDAPGEPYAEEGHHRFVAGEGVAWLGVVAWTRAAGAEAGRIRAPLGGVIVQSISPAMQIGVLDPRPCVALDETQGLLHGEARAGWRWSGPCHGRSWS